MPTSKKPRKAHRRKKVSFGYFKDDIDTMRGFFQHTNYSLLEALPRGVATKVEIDAMIDANNVVLASVCARKDLADASKREIYALVEPANTCLAYIKKRGEKTGHYVGTGDELRTITDAAGAVYPYIDESIQNCPTTFLKEFIASKNLTKEKS